MNPRPDVTDHPTCVLIVDDERLHRRLLEVMLAPEGYVLVTAASGEEALAIVARQPPDLVLLNVMMPGMDGYQVARELKAGRATRNIPIIMITALDTRNARMLGLSAGAVDCLTKPIDRAELCMRVRNLLRLKAYGAYYDRYSQTLEGEVRARTADLIERTMTLEQQAAVLTEQAALLDLAQDAIVVLDMHRHILFWSRGAEALYGWSSEEVLGRNTTDVLRSQFSEALRQIEATLLREGRWEGEAVHHTRDGSLVAVASHSALQRDADGAPVRVLTIDSDITKHRQAECERRLLTDRLSLATAVARVGVWEWDLPSNMMTWDATMFEIYGFSPIVPMRYEQWSAAVHLEDLAGVEASFRKAIDEQGQGSAEFRITRNDGSTRNVSAVARVVLDDRSRVRRLIGVNMDVTERKEVEETLERNRADQMRIKDEFLSHVSHELRSPLTAIKQFTTILLGGLAGELNAEQRQYQQIVLKNILQLQAMIDDLLEVTRFQTGKLTVELERVIVSSAVTDAVETVQVTARAKDVSLSHDLSPDLPPACTDETRLRQILIILLDNAIKFTPGGGVVRIQARRQQYARGFLRIDVSDTGCGLTPEAAVKIFERLYQASQPSSGSRQGLGLGLYICKELVTSLGGRIWVTIQRPRGCTFSFTLPMYSPDTVSGPFAGHDRAHLDASIKPRIIPEAAPV